MHPMFPYCIVGDHPTKIFLKVSPVAVFIKINYLPLVPDHLNEWFWHDLTQNLGYFGLFQGFRGPKMQK